YCKPNNEGIATVSDTGYRVMERTGANQVLVLLNSVPANQSNLVKELKELAKLKEQGYLTEEEFQIGKQKLLNS
ncbi:MAG: SHOCT domain-containing protein, partial [Bacillota bacterium]